MAIGLKSVLVLVVVIAVVYLRGRHSGKGRGRGKREGDNNRADIQGPSNLFHEKGDSH